MQGVPGTNTTPPGALPTAPGARQAKARGAMVYLPSPPAPFSFCEWWEAEMSEETGSGRALPTAQELFEAIPDAALVVDPDSHILRANAQAGRLLGYGPGELEGRPIDCLIPEAQRAAHRRHVREYRRAPRMRPMAASRVLQARHRDGTLLPVAIELSPVATDRGLLVLCILRDLREKLAAEEARRVAEERYRLLYEQAPSIFFTLDREGRIRSINAFGAEHLGTSPQELAGRPWTGLVPAAEREEMARRLERCRRHPQMVHRWDVSLRAGGERMCQVQVNARCLGDDGGELLLVCEDVTEQRRLSRVLSHQATHDPLTDLLNRTGLNQALERLLHARDEGREHAVCFIDLDQFKVVNDSCGHLAGDELLRRVAAALGRRLRGRDTLARVGGDEFVALLYDCDAEHAREVAEGLCEEVARLRFDWEGRLFRLSASVGVVPVHGAPSPEEVMRQADSACYLAKELGRNRVHLYHPQDSEVSRLEGAMAWISVINRALEKDGFLLHHQVIAPLSDPGRGLHYEVLLRLRGEHGLPTPPGAFLPTAERYGLSGRIDLWVLRETFRWLQAHPEHLQSLALCSINLSGQTLADEGVLERIPGLFREYAIPHERICFEVTETAAISHLDTACRFMRALNERGVRFALDDFGSGLSSFAYLRSLPVQIVKIDGLFVKNIARDRTDAALVRAINQVAHEMGKQTVAEFVEDQGILERLREIGVDYAQGYAIARPRSLFEAGTRS